MSLNRLANKAPLPRVPKRGSRCFSINQPRPWRDEAKQKTAANGFLVWLSSFHPFLDVFTRVIRSFLENPAAQIVRAFAHGNTWTMLQLAHESWYFVKRRRSVSAILCQRFLANGPQGASRSHLPWMRSADRVYRESTIQFYNYEIANGTADDDGHDDARSRLGMFARIFRAETKSVLIVRRDRSALLDDVSCLWSTFTFKPKRRMVFEDASGITREQGKALERSLI